MLSIVQLIIVSFILRHIIKENLKSVENFPTHIIIIVCDVLIFSIGLAAIIILWIQGG